MRFKIFAASLVFICDFIASSAGAVIIDRIAAIVNQDVIVHSELQALGKLNLDISGLPKRDNLLQRRIDHYLVLQQLAEQPPIELSAEEVQLSIRQLMTRFGTEQDMLKFLTTIGMTYADLDAEIREQITIRKFIGLRFRPFVNITIEEAEKYYREVHKPLGEEMGQTVPSFEESFSEIQTLLVESKVQDKIQEWLQDLRKQASINIKD